MAYVIVDTDKLARVDELREEAETLGGFYDAYGAEWGDRYAEALSELAEAEIGAGLRDR